MYTTFYARKTISISGDFSFRFISRLEYLISTRVQIKSHYIGTHV
jgi:hypothetical protein